MLQESAYHNKVADEFMRAAIGVGSWQKAVDGVADLTHSARAQLIGANGANQIAFIWGAEYSKKAYKEYLAINADSPKINPRWWATEAFRELEVVGDSEYDKIYPKLLNSDYLDYSRRWDMPHGCQTVVSRAKNFNTALLALRSKADGRANEETYAAMAHIAPQVAAAVNLARNLDTQQQLLLANAFEGLSATAIICDLKLRLLSITESAQTLFLSNNFISIEGGKISSPISLGKKKIEGALARLIAGHSEVTVVLRAGVEGENSVVLDFHLLPAMENSLFQAPRVIITSRKFAKPFGLQLLNEIYSLTEAEAEIARDLVSGKSRQEIADKRDVSIETIRSQIKNIFSKTDVSREIELVSKISSCKAIG